MIRSIALVLFALAPDAARPPFSSGHDLVYHDGFARVLLLNVVPEAPPRAGETIPIYKWNEGRWEPLATAGGPTMRAVFGVAYDARRDRLVIHGGATVVNREPIEIRHHADTWEWNAHESTWERFDGGGPGARNHHAMAYDAARGRVVLFGGEDENGAPLSDTWEWDGKTWTRVGEDGPRPKGGRARLVWDAGRETVLLFGDGPRDPWAWDGSAWRSIGGSGHPAPRAGGVVAHDRVRKRTIVFGGRTAAGFERDAWAFTGAGWTRLAEDMPSHRAFAAMAFDAKRGKLVLHGGLDDEGMLGDTWEIGEPGLRAIDTGERPVDGAPARPELRTHFPADFDAGLGKVVLAGGSAPVRPGEPFMGDVWTWDGKRWEKIAETDFLSNSHRLVWDSKGKRLLAFGGFHYTNRTDARALGALRVFERGRWRTIDDSPDRAMAEGGVVFDTARHRLVAYGGGLDEGDAATWEWDGAKWARSAGPSPPRRDGFAMAYDARRKRAVLFGGAGRERGPLAETWEYDGARWTLASEIGGPGARVGAHMAYDAKRQELLLFGGESNAEARRRPVANSDTWTWDGATWRRLAEDGPSNVTGSDGAMTYDARRERVVLIVSRYQRRLDRPVEVWEWDGAKWERVDPR